VWRRGLQILIWTVVVVVGGGFLVGSAIGMWLYINHDRPELIDDEVLAARITSACATMTDRVRAAAVPTTSPAAARAAAVKRQDQAVRDFVESVRTVGDERLDGDLPSKDWLRDWESIAVLRDRAAADLEAGRKPSFVLPKIDGHPITYRMDYASSCTVPTELTTLS
jgi:hypothetical protein